MYRIKNVFRRKEPEMGEKKRHLVPGIVILSIGVAIMVNYFTAEGTYYGPIILLGVGLALLIRSATVEPEKRKTPVGGIILVAIGAVSLIDSLTGSDIITSVVRAVAPLILPLVLIILGLRLLFK
jgi:peptidoglycan/LPS O-acetylase OafA/YrhL